MGMKLLDAAPPAPSVCGVCQTRPVFVESVIPFTHVRVSYCASCLVTVADEIKALVGVS